MIKILFRAPLVGALLLGACAHAHVTLVTPSAVAGSHHKAVLTIGHGCDGQPTHAVTVRIPAGFQGARPGAKPGWTVTIRREPLARPYTSHGKTVTEDVTEIVWTARSDEARLPDDQFDEFAVRGQIAAAPGPMWFKVRQDCPAGQLDWNEIPADGGTSTRGLKAPAALLRVEPAEGEHAHH